tara:strand:- start:750 stop:1643 length:894 start_codon:yes stop_codon:yes gene_type:complete
MIYSHYIHPIRYFLKTFVSSPFQANKELFYDLKKDFLLSKKSKYQKLIWVCGLPKSGTTLIGSIMNFVGYVEGNKSILRKFDSSGIKHPHEITDGFFKYFPKNKHTFVKTHSHHKTQFIKIAEKYHTTNIVTLRDIRPMMLSRYWHVMSDENHWQHKFVKDLNFEEGFKKSLIYGYSYEKLSPIEYYQKWIIDWLSNKHDANLILWFEDYKSKPLDYISKINQCINCDIEPSLIEKYLDDVRKDNKIENLSLSEKLKLPGRSKTTIRNFNENWKEVISDKLNQWILSNLSDELTLKE